MDLQLTEKIVVITGASSGIGRATALKLASAGCDVAIAYHNSHDEADAVCASVRALGRRAKAIQADVSESERVAEAFDTFRQEFDRVVAVFLAGVRKAAG